MAMVSMKTDDSGVDCCTPNPYGYGLRIRLNDDQCEALGITTPPTAGSKVSINAVAFVAEATQRTEEDGDDKGPDVCIELQITDMEVTPSRGVVDAKVLFPDMN